MSKAAKAFGEKLAQQRAERGLTLDAVALATKVRRNYLAALEEGSLEHLPPLIFVEGFLKAYASQVGLNPGQVVEEFRRVYPALDPPAKPLKPAAAPRTRARMGAWGGWLSALVLAGAVLAAAVWLVPRLLPTGSQTEPPLATPRKHRAPVQQPAPNDQAKEPPALPPIPAEAPKPAGTTLESASATASEANAASDGALATTAGGENAAPPAVAAPPPAEQDLVISAKGPCWCEIWSDGRRLVYRQLGAGERVGLKGERFQVSLGNTGDVDLVFRGRPVPLPEERGHVVKNLLLPPGSGAAPP